MSGPRKKLVKLLGLLHGLLSILFLGHSLKWKMICHLKFIMHMLELSYQNMASLYCHWWSKDYIQNLFSQMQTTN
jgi:hypothetical protein